MKSKRWSWYQKEVSFALCIDDGIRDPRFANDGLCRPEHDTIYFVTCSNSGHFEYSGPGGRVYLYMMEDLVVHWDRFREPALADPVVWQCGAWAGHFWVRIFEPPPPPPPPPPPVGAH